mmetsp:Transcript_93639/g.202519  ORF Transcript_93639/g.202519 Transcript_93639/m.202519 type:complete len:102 (-) Transcript_93639:117-422(-)
MCPIPSSQTAGDALPTPQGQVNARATRNAPLSQLPRRALDEVWAEAKAKAQEQVRARAREDAWDETQVAAARRINALGLELSMLTMSPDASQRLLSRNRRE